MIEFESFPRITISHTPTPLEKAPRLSDDLGCNVYIKRDDCTGLAGGGNKTRKLEYLLADAKVQGADTLVTIGGLQSNHARQTAAAAAKFGFNCELILQDVIGTPEKDYKTNGNILLDHLFGAKIHRLSADEDCEIYAATLMNQLQCEGKTPYLIPIGGSNEIGSLGYIRCANELLGQIKAQDIHIDQIILATGSAGTQAGLLAGLIAAKSHISVLGINVSRPAQEQTELVESLLKNILRSLNLDQNLANGRVFTNGSYYGEGYGVATKEMVAAVKKCAELEGLLLDPVYSGKAMAGFIDLCQTKHIKASSNQVFLHTGGSVGLFAYREVFY
ncbi:MAG: D-cysteine desulfhydrase [Colwellia sp.]|nr:D-cysteine desulfhydrase [Colwellia sp.]